MTDTLITVTVSDTIVTHEAIVRGAEYGRSARDEVSVEDSSFKSLQTRTESPKQFVYEPVHALICVVALALLARYQALR